MAGKGKDIAALMKRHSKAWKEAETRSRGILPEGQYQFEITLPEGRPIVVEDSDKRVRCRIGLTVVSGPEKSEGRTHAQAYGIFTADGEPDEMGFSIMKAHLDAIGVDVDGLELSDVAQTWKGLEGTIVAAQVRHRQDKNDNTQMQVFINSLVEEPAKKAIKKGAKKSRRLE